MQATSCTEMNPTEEWQDFLHYDEIAELSSVIFNLNSKIKSKKPTKSLKTAQKKRNFRGKKKPNHNW